MGNLEWQEIVIGSDVQLVSDCDDIQIEYLIMRNQGVYCKKLTRACASFSFEVIGYSNSDQILKNYAQLDAGSIQVKEMLQNAFEFACDELAPFGFTISEDHGKFYATRRKDGFRETVTIDPFAVYNPIFLKSEAGIRFFRVDTTPDCMETLIECVNKLVDELS